MEAFLDVKYKQTAVENQDEFLEVMNVNFVLRQLAKINNSVNYLSRDGDSYVFTIESLVKTVKSVIKINEEYDDIRLDDVKVKGFATIEGNKLIRVQTEPSGRKTKAVYEFTPDKLTITTTVDGWDKKLIRHAERVK